MTSTMQTIGAKYRRNPYQLCRLCLREDFLENLFESEGIQKWISEYLHMKVSTEDRLSQVICAVCRLRLTEFHNLRMQCQEVQGILQKQLVEYTRIHGPKNHICHICGKIFGLRRFLNAHIKCHAGNQPAHEISVKESNLDELPAIKLESREDMDQLTETPWEESETVSTVEAESGHCISMEYDLAKSASIKLKIVSENLPYRQDEEVYDEVHIEQIKIEEQLAENIAIDTSENETVNRPDRNLAHEDQIYQCNVCRKVFSTERKLAIHGKVHKPKIHVCHVCDCRYAVRGEFNRHFLSKTHLKNVEKMSNCDDSTDTQADKSEEVKQNDDAQQYECDECHKSYSNALKLKDHKRLVHGFKKFACPFCDKKFTQSGHLRSHVRTHNKIGSLKCGICLKEYAREDELWFHMKSQHVHISHPCGVCTKVFVTKSALVRHEATHRTSEEKKQDDEVGGPYKCDVCQRILTSWTHYRQHKRYQHEAKNHTCSVCGEVFVFRKRLLKHLRAHERHKARKTGNSKSGDKPFKCNACPYSFEHESSLRFHVMYTHGVKRHGCHICSSKFYWRSRLKRHLAETHKLNSDSQQLPVENSATNLDGRHIDREATSSKTATDSTNSTTMPLLGEPEPGVSPLQMSLEIPKLEFFVDAPQ